MKTILQGWNVMRILRLVLAAVILVQGIIASEMASIFLGAVFGGMALLNVGCCGAGNCAINPPGSLKKEKEYDSPGN